MTSEAKAIRLASFKKKKIKTYSLTSAKFSLFPKIPLKKGVKKTFFSR